MTCTPNIKLNSRWITDLNMKTGTILFLKKQGEYIYEVGQRFLRM